MLNQPFWHHSYNTVLGLLQKERKKKHFPCLTLRMQECAVGSMKIHMQKQFTNRGRQEAVNH